MSARPSDDQPSREIREQLLSLYAELDAEIAARAPRCDQSGRCCRFTEYGHLLFLSDPEADLLVENPPRAEATIGPDRCPYQEGNRCVARERRPLGCRLYFCDESFAAEMPELSEKWIARLKALHGEAALAWRYQRLEDHLRERLGSRPPGPLAILEIS